MRTHRLAFMAVIVSAMGLGSAGAQAPGSSTWEPSTSLTFHQYFEPFPRVDSPQACRDVCLRDTRCTGWTYYHADFEAKTPEGNTLRRACILGASLKGRTSGTAVGRTSGQIAGR